MGRGAKVGDAQRAQVRELVLRQRLRRGQVEHRRTPLALGPPAGDDLGQPGEQVPQRLAGRGAGRHHGVVALVGQGGRLRLVLPGLAYADPLPGLDDLGVGPLRPRAGAGGAWRQHLEVGEPLVPPGRAGEALHQHLDGNRAHTWSLSAGGDALGAGSGRGSHG